MATPNSKTPVTILKEYSDKRNIQPNYEEIINDGDVNEKFICNVTVGDKTTASGKGLSKKIAKHAAAQQALDNLVELGEFNSSADIASSPSSCKSSTNPVGQLQELLAKRGQPLPKYDFAVEGSCSHAPTFTCTVTVEHLNAIGGDKHIQRTVGIGGSKIIAKTEAAKNLLEYLEAEVEEKKKTTRSSIQEETKLNKERCSSSYKSRFMEDFELIRSLGEGGYGRVFEAKNIKDGQRYAIKRINLDESDMSEEKSMREVGALAQLDHPNIVRYFGTWVEHPTSDEYMEMKNLQSSSASASRDQNSVQFPLKDEGRSVSTDGASDSVVFRNSNAVTSDESSSVDESSYSDTDYTCSTEKDQSKSNLHPINLLFIQMQLCSGSLKDWLIEKAPQVDHRSKLNVFRELLSAVEYIHRKGLIHRDIKPGNIFLSEDDHIKLGDFGLARFLGSTATANSGMEKLSLVGTVTYMSPEQGSGRYDQKADIYPLGLILLEMCVPMAASHHERCKTLLSVKDGTLPPKFEQNFPEECQLVRKMTETDPEWRPQAIDLLHNSLFKDI